MSLSQRQQKLNEQRKINEYKNKKSTQFFVIKNELIFTSNFISNKKTNFFKMGNSSSHTHEPLDKGFTRGTYGDVKNTVCNFFMFFFIFDFYF